MSATVIKVIAKPGTTYNVNDTGAVDIVQKYQVILSEPLNSGQLLTSFTGIPAIGSVHPARSGYYAALYKISQPEGADKSTLDIEVHYSAQAFTTEGGVVVERIDQWGWDDSTTQRELTSDIDGKTVLNSAGDTFESVPAVVTPSPTFTKVSRFSSRKSDWAAYNCTVNSSSVTIGGQSFPAHTLLCTISESIIIGAENFKYQYTVHFRYRTNMATIKGAETAEECGWDEVITDAGMRSKNASTGKLELIKIADAETGMPIAITSPELLDGNGQPVSRSPSGQGDVKPYNFRIEA